MENRSDIRDFLATRRAGLTPDDVGLPAGGNRRRVPGLRREEVAVLAGVSTEWYTRLEKGHINGVSDDVLEAVARALQLDEAERGYLVALLRAEAGRDPHNKELRQLVGELSTLSDEFRTRWATHNVRIHHAGKKQFHNPEVGPLDLFYHSLDLAADDDGVLDLTIYTTEPGTPSEDRLKLLASWAASEAPPEPPPN